MTEKVVPVPPAVDRETKAVPDAFVLPGGFVTEKLILIGRVPFDATCVFAVQLVTEALDPTAPQPVGTEVFSILLPSVLDQLRLAVNATVALPPLFTTVPSTMKLFPLVPGCPLDFERMAGPEVTVPASAGVAATTCTSGTVHAVTTAPRTTVRRPTTRLEASVM